MPWAALPTNHLPLRLFSMPASRRFTEPYSIEAVYSTGEAVLGQKISGLTSQSVD